MLKIFAKNGSGQFVVLFLAIALLWMKGFLQPAPMRWENGFSPFYDVLYDWLMPHPILATILAMLLTIAEGVMLCMILYNHKMLAAPTFLPILFFILTMGFQHDATTMTPILICSFFTLLSLRQLMMGDNQNLPADRLCNATLFISLSTLFYMPAACLLLPLLIVATIYKLYGWRDWVVILLGLMSPYILLMTYYYMTDKLDYMMYLMGNDIAELKATVLPMSPLQWVSNIMLVLFIVWCLFSAFGNGDATTDFRRNNALIMLIALASLAMMFFDNMLPFNSQLFAIPFAYSASLHFMNKKRRLWVFDIVIIVLFGLGGLAT